MAVVEALLDVLGPSGTLVVPTHSGDNSDPAEWRRPWLGALRSSHPRTSFAAIDASAALITDKHSLDSPMGENSPLARIYDLDPPYF